ncbi:glutathione peroxidase 3-like [Glandiceps talaboti]
MIGLTRQYLELNALMDEFRDYNFTVLAYPTNHFGKQEPGSNSEILNTLKYVRPGGGYEPNFPVFQKGNVNGGRSQAVWQYLRDTCKSPEGYLGYSTTLFWYPYHSDDIRWTFRERFIIDPNGFPYIRINDGRNPYRRRGLRDDIEQYLTERYIDLV